MSVKIRCRRSGANNDPCFRIVATDGRSPRDGKYLELLGWYDPKKKTQNFRLNLERVEAWKQRGAQISDIVKDLMRRAKKGGMAPAPQPAAKTPAAVATPVASAS